MQFLIEQRNALKPKVGAFQAVAIRTRILANEPSKFGHLAVCIIFRKFKSDAVQHLDESRRFESIAINIDSRKRDEGDFGHARGLNSISL
jgi:hypothetical protein